MTSDTSGEPADQWTLVDDGYWLKRAADLTAGGSSVRTDAARQLMAALSWLWTVYTGAAVVGVLAGDAALGGVAVWFLSAPSVVIVVAYAAAVYAYMPLTVRFDPRDPEEIRVAHETGAIRGWIRLRVALLLALVAALSIAAAVAAATVAR